MEEVWMASNKWWYAYEDLATTDSHVALRRRRYETLDHVVKRSMHTSLKCSAAAAQREGGAYSSCICKNYQNRDLSLTYNYRVSASVTDTNVWLWA